MKKLLVAFILAASVFTLNSCRPQRYTVVEQPAAPVYVRPASPGPAYVWVDGDWRWQGGKYVYTNGYWARPKARRTYVSGSWVKADKGYYWKRGYWR